MYYPLKLLHVGFAAVSIGLFLYRGVLMLRRSNRLTLPVWRTLPHVVDTGLLASGVALVVLLSGQPITQLWLQSKLVLIFAYIAFGAVALNYGKTYKKRATALFFATLLLVLIVLTAIRQMPAGLYAS